VIPALEGQELMDGSNSGGVFGMNSKPAATGERIHGVGDTGSLLSHDCGARDLTIVNEPGKDEVPACERVSNFLHVTTDLGGSGRVDTIPLEGNAATIGQRLEAM
jgi:hypothetical protein